MKYTLIALGSIVLFTGCAPYQKSPVELTGELNRRYGYRPVSEFFEKYGLPAGEFTLPDGNHAYRWVSVEHARTPPTVNYASYPSYNGVSQIVDTYNGITETHYCELRIYIDNQDAVLKFAVAVDSTGKWSASRCSEIF